MEGSYNYGKVKDCNPVVSTVHGSVMGENRNGIAVFRGIPYGFDTGGQYRFQAPRAAEPWDGIRDCSSKNGPICPQFGQGSVSNPNVPYWDAGHPEKFRTDTETRSEDCLCLNVLTPGIDDRKRPVLVYFHGGGFATGSGTLVLGADQWVREQNFVIVGVNHRLNVFGYMYLGGVDPKYRSSGMCGMLDLVLALHWVRDNIAAFGGDPETVTIMGESGGGMKVSTLMDMEEARGLFVRGIVVSGSSPTGAVLPEEAEQNTAVVMERLGVHSVEELQSIPAEALLSASEGLRFDPVADDIHLMSNPEKSFRAPLLDLPVMIGSSEDEMAVFMKIDDLRFGWDELRDRLTHLTAGRLMKAVSEEDADRIIETFKNTDKKGNDAPHLYCKIVSMNDTLGDRAFYQSLAYAEKNESPVYHYLIAYDSPYEQDLSWHVSWHTHELPLIMRIVAYPEEGEIMSRKFSQSWANFVKYGNPDTEEWKWEPFRPETRRVFVIDDVSRVETDPIRPYREAFGRYI